MSSTQAEDETLACQEHAHSCNEPSETKQSISTALTAILEANEIDIFLAALSEIDIDSAESIQVSELCDALGKVLETTKRSIVSSPLNPSSQDQDDTSRRLATTKQLEEAGVIELALSAMLKHPLNADVQMQCINALQLVARNGPATSKRMGELKCIQLVVRCMIQHKKNVQLQKAGTELLLALTFDKENRGIMGEYYAIEVVVTAMKAQAEDPIESSIGCAFLANVSYESESNKAMIVKSGGVKALLRALKHHLTSSPVCLWSCLALRNLSLNNTETCALLRRLGALRLVLNAMFSFKEDLKLQEHGVTVVRNMLSASLAGQDTSVIQRLVELHGLEYIVRCLRSFRTAEGLQIACVSALRLVTSASETHARLVVSVSGLEAVVSAMLAMRAVCDLQEEAIAILRTCINLGPDVKRRLVTANASDTISLVLKTHITNETLIADGLLIIRQLRGATSLGERTQRPGPMV